MVQKSKAREQITSSPTLRGLLDELMEECRKALGLWDQLMKEKRPEKRDALESQLYVAMVRWEAKLASALKEWDRVVDEELSND